MKLDVEDTVKASGQLELLQDKELPKELLLL